MKIFKHREISKCSERLIPVFCEQAFSCLTNDEEGPRVCFLSKILQWIQHLYTKKQSRGWLHTSCVHDLIFTKFVSLVMKVIIFFKHNQVKTPSPVKSTMGLSSWLCTLVDRCSILALCPELRWSKRLDMTANRLRSDADSDIAATSNPRSSRFASVFEVLPPGSEVRLMRVSPVPSTVLSQDDVRGVSFSSQLRDLARVAVSSEKNGVSKSDDSRRLRRRISRKQTSSSCVAYFEYSPSASKLFLRYSFWPWLRIRWRAAINTEMDHVVP